MSERNSVFEVGMSSTTCALSLYKFDKHTWCGTPLPAFASGCENMLLIQFKKFQLSFLRLSYESVHFSLMCCVTAHTIILYAFVSFIHGIPASKRVGEVSGLNMKFKSMFEHENKMRFLDLRASFYEAFDEKLMRHFFHSSKSKHRKIKRRWIVNNLW